MSKLNILRGTYGGFEGPMFRGTAPMTVTPAAEPLHKLLGVTTATEGGCFDSFNGYDRCVISIGPLQLCGMLGLCHPLLRMIQEQVNAEHRAALQAWERQYMPAGPGLVEILGPARPKTTEALAQALYGCNGRQGSWTQQNWDQANALVAALVPFLTNNLARHIQLDHLASRILSFVMPETRRILFQDLHGEGWMGALQAAVVSFSANLPAVADKHFRAYVAKAGPPRDSQLYFLEALDAMTYGPKIAIYPHRRQAILGPIQRLYGVSITQDVTTPVRFVPLSTLELQQLLVRLGYDLGPAGADGKFGPKTDAAVRSFQKQHGLGVDGIVGPKTLAKLREEGEKKELACPKPRTRSCFD